MGKYIYLILGVLTVMCAIATAAYGLCIDKIHVFGEGVMYGVTTILLFYFYSEAKKQEDNGI